jgi:hypothetical protein
VEEPPKQFSLPLTGKSPKSRRTFAAIGNVLVFLIGAWKVHLGSVSLVSFSTVAPFLSIGCVWYGVKQKRLVEALGWGLWVILVAIHIFPMMFSVVSLVLSTAFEHWSHP